MRNKKDFVVRSIPLDLFPGCRAGAFFRTAHRMEAGNYACTVMPADLGARAFDGDFEMLAHVKELERKRVLEIGKEENHGTVGDLFR